jgi:hypothetical protein
MESVLDSEAECSACKTSIKLSLSPCALHFSPFPKPKREVPKQISLVFWVDTMTYFPLA